MIEDAAKPQGLAPATSRPRAINRDLFRQASVLIGCVGLFAIFSILTSSFYQPSNLIDIMLQSAINAIIAVGMTLVIITRGIDLSVGSIVGLSSMVASDLMSHNMALGIIAGSRRRAGVRSRQRAPDREAETSRFHRHARDAERLSRRGAHLYQRTTDLWSARGIPRRLRRPDARRADARDPGHRRRRAGLLPRSLYGARRTDRRRGRQRGSRAALGHQHRSGQDHRLYLVRTAFEPGGVRAHRAHRRGRADRRKRLRTAGHRRGGHRRRKPLRRRGQPAWLADRRADAWADFRMA